MNGIDIIRRIREKNHLGADTPVGAWGSTAKDATVEGDNRTLVVVATTSDVDLDREVIVPDGADPTYFFKNGKIFADHNYSIESCVGRLRSASLFGPKDAPVGWKVRYTLFDLPLANDILTMAKAGAAPGVSIGFIAQDYGAMTKDESSRFPLGRSIVRKWKWLELSATCQPCNVACQTLDARPVTDDRKAGIIDGLMVKGAIRPESAYALGFPRERKAAGKPVVLKCVA